MDKKQAQALIKETFESTFDKGRFVGFTKNLLNDVEEATFMYKGNYIPDAYEQYINTLERIGKYTDGEHKIDILIAKLKKETSIERARTMQRNFIAWYLNGSRGGEMKDAALVAFVSPTEKDWRFSLVKMDYRFEESKKGRMRVKEEFTPARRWSFLVGVNENSHTAQSQLVSLVADDERNPVLAQLEEAFNIEKVTREFFEKYRELFLWTKETLSDTVKKNKKIMEDFEAKRVSTVDFSKKLLGQIVFLYFLQKKGWFGVKRDAAWGTGPKNFLRELFEKKHGIYNNFFNDILEPLFYEALARERDDDFYSRFDCKIPFLNGGLFDPINDYDWVHTDILLPNDLFSNSYKTKEGDKGNGILDIFDRYNFTVKEDEPLEKEVAVDPEMLGKVFENLLEVKDRKSKGTYYTPREIVHYMCVQSLVVYLTTELEGKVTNDDCEKLIKYGEAVSENEARVMAMGKETQTYYYKLPENVRVNANVIDKKLADIKICDPAIGSGAFPVGMMTEIVRARNALSSYIKDSYRTLYNFKRDCIHKSLYGVDIDPGAVEIAKLRLWLSLVVDEDDIKQIKPLPNLEYKIMQGNSLLEEFEGVRLFDERIINTVDFDKDKQTADLKEKQSNLSSEYIKLHQANKLTYMQKRQFNDELKKISSQIRRLVQSGKATVENASLFDMFSDAKKKSDDLKQLHKEFFETTQKTIKDDLRRRIEKLEWGLIEVTLKEQGKQSELKKLEEFKRSNVKPFFLWKLHFSEVFQNGGFNVVIANPPWVSNDNIDDQDKEIFKRNYTVAKGRFDLANLLVEKALNILKKNGLIFFVIPEHIWLGDYFIQFRRYLSENSNVLEIVSSKETSFEQVSNPSSIFLAQNSKVALKSHLFEVGTFYKGDSPLKFRTNQCIEGRIIFNEFIQNLNKKISSQNFTTLAEIALVTDGIQTADLLKTIFTQEPKDKKKCFKALRSGKDIKFRYAFIEWSGWWVLKPEYTRTMKRPGFSYDSPKRMLCFMAKEKVILRQTEPTILATLDIDGYYFPNSIFQIAFEKEEPKKLRWILGLLNSKFLRFYYGKLAQVEGTTKPQIYLNVLKALPIPSGFVGEIAGIVNEILLITKSSDYLTNTKKQAKVNEYERQIDQMVYELYGLTKKEIKIVEGLGKED
jgi:hypothetical protein